MNCVKCLSGSSLRDVNARTKATAQAMIYSIPGSKIEYSTIPAALYRPAKYLKIAWKGYKWDNGCSDTRYSPD